MRTNLKILRDEKTQKVKAIIVNDKYEFRGDSKWYDVRYSYKELEEYPSWLDAPDIREMLMGMWKSLTPKQIKKT